MIVTLVVVDTADVETVNVAEVDPAATVTEAGTVAKSELEVSTTTMPPLGAGPLSVTVPVDGAPPWTDPGVSVMALTVGAWTVKGELTVTTPSAALMFAVVFVVTADVAIVNVAVEAPVGTVTVAGIVALG